MRNGTFLSEPIIGSSELNDDFEKRTHDRPIQSGCHNTCHNTYSKNLNSTPQLKKYRKGYVVGGPLSRMKNTIK